MGVLWDIILRILIEELWGEMFYVKISLRNMSEAEFAVGSGILNLSKRLMVIMHAKAQYKMLGFPRDFLPGALFLAVVQSSTTSIR